MNKINCEICMDLLPLVIDGVASEQSEQAVVEHTESCESCKEIFETYEKPKPDDTKIIKKIKSRLYSLASVLVVGGISVGSSLMLSGGQYYNILIMPVIGALSYFALKSKLHIVTIAVFAVSFIRNYLFRPHFQVGIFYAFVYCGLMLLGVLIAFLFDFGLKKENETTKQKKENENNES